MRVGPDNWVQVSGGGRGASPVQEARPKNAEGGDANSKGGSGACSERWRNDILLNNADSSQPGANIPHHDQDTCTNCEPEPVEAKHTDGFDFSNESDSGFCRL